MKKDVKAPLKVLNGKETPKNETLKAELKTIKTAEPSKEDLLKKVTELEKQLSTVPKNLDEKILFYNRKRELITKLARLKASHESLNEHIEKLAELSEENDFKTNEYVLNIEGGSQYNKKDVFTLDNPLIIGGVINYIIELMEEKEKQIQAEIEA